METRSESYNVENKITIFTKEPHHTDSEQSCSGSDDFRNLKRKKQGGSFVGFSTHSHYLRTYFNEYLPQLPVTKLEGTYLVWVDCRTLKKSSEEIEALLLEKEKLWINAGSMYGQAGEGFIRINIAVPGRY